MKLFVNPKDKILSDSIIRDGVWEPQETEFIQKYIKKGWIVIDIGANIGYYTLLFSKLVGEKGKVYAFEPDPENFIILRRNISENKLKNVFLIKKAVANTDRKIKLFLDEENKGDHKIYNSFDSRQSININSVKLDSLLGKSTKKVNFIKMDIQGAEYLALLGMQKLLNNQKDISIISEYWPMGLHKAGGKPENYINLLKKNAFRLFQLDDRTGKYNVLNEKKLYKEVTINNKRYTNLLCIKST